MQYQRPSLPRTMPIPIMRKQCKQHLIVLYMYTTNHLGYNLCRKLCYATRVYYYAFMCVSMNLCTCVCMHVCMSVCIGIHMYVYYVRSQCSSTNNLLTYLLIRSSDNKFFKYHMFLLYRQTEKEGGAETETNTHTDKQIQKD